MGNVAARLDYAAARGRCHGPGGLSCSGTGPTALTPFARSILALTERFHGGWSATDGAALPTLRVEGDFLGCVVERGVHRVTLRFMPRSFVYGALASALGAVLLAGVLIVRSR